MIFNAKTTQCAMHWKEMDECGDFIITFPSNVIKAYFLCALMLLDRVNRIWSVIKGRDSDIYEWFFLAKGLIPIFYLSWNQKKNNKKTIWESERDKNNEIELK